MRAERNLKLVDSGRALFTSENGQPLFRPFQVVSLLEMVECPLVYLIDLNLRLIEIQKRIRKRTPLAPVETSGLLQWVGAIKHAASLIQIDLSYFCSRITDKINSPGVINVTLSQLLSELRAGWQNELRQRKLMFVPMADVAFLNQEAMFGPEVATSIAEAQADIKAAGNCYGTGNYTASVFHLMRVAEFGLRKIAKKLNVKLTIKGKPVTVEYAVWDQIITGCNNKIAKIRQGHLGKKREEQLELYSAAAQHCLFMKDIWRNSVSHARKPYNQPEALAVMARVKDFMRFLAVNVP